MGLVNFPVMTLKELDTLDDNEIVLGYRSALRGELMPQSATKAFWHGWRNGLVDSNRVEIDDCQRMLARRVVERTKQQRG